MLFNEYEQCRSTDATFALLFQSFPITSAGSLCKNWVLKATREKKINIMFEQVENDATTKIMIS